MLKFFEEFKNFAVKGNRVNIAIGIIIGTAFKPRPKIPRIPRSKPLRTSSCGQILKSYWRSKIDC
jgi:Large-conductance mechanosensitive channel, MscL